ncbi:hypothetical protein CCMA1212_004482 [Trichoderma ghanense]|uniref:Uncharacterized protein n=1 Tax=Trichoderma ghanense TaxID=65468 RepID=A0ABY2H652_9HYPO
MTMAVSCAHSFVMIKSDNTLVQWICQHCRSGPHWAIYECTYCKLHLCRPCPLDDPFFSVDYRAYSLGTRVKMERKALKAAYCIYTCRLLAEAAAPDPRSASLFPSCLFSLCLSCISTRSWLQVPRGRFLQRTLYGISHHDPDKGPCKALPSKWTLQLRLMECFLEVSRCDSAKSYTWPQPGSPPYLGIEALRLTDGLLSTNWSSYSTYPLQKEGARARR